LNELDVSINPLSRIYDFTKANYYGVLVYLTRTINGVTTTKQLIKNVDYIVSSDLTFIDCYIRFTSKDKVTVQEYRSDIWFI